MSYVDRRPLMSPTSTQTMQEDPLAFFSRASRQPSQQQPQQQSSSSSSNSFAASNPLAWNRGLPPPHSSFSATHPSGLPLPSVPHMSDELPSSYPAANASYSYASPPVVQRVSLQDSPLQSFANPPGLRQFQLSQAAPAPSEPQPRNFNPDFSSFGSAPVSSRGRPAAEAPAPAAAAGPPALPPPPAPVALPSVDPLSRMSALSRGSYGSYSAPDCPHIVTRLMMPIYLFLTLFVVIVYSLENNRCDALPYAPDHGWCCMKAGFSRYLSILTFVIHAVMLTWLLQLYHTPYFTFFPRHNRNLILVSFFMRAAFLVVVWMLYFLILSLNLISTLPEQVTCSGTVYDRYLFYPAAVLNIACCLFIKVMLGLMGKSIWKYWELRHLTPEELIVYEEQLEDNKHFGLTREQVDVLTNVILTCQDTVSDGSTCGVCGYSAEYQPPSLAHVIGEKMAPRINAVNSFLHRRRSSAAGEGGADELFAGVQIRSDEPQADEAGYQDYRPPSHDPSPPSSHPASPQPVPYPSELERQSSSSSNENAQPKSKASLVAKGGLPSMMCGICIDDYRFHDRVLILPCRHHGHIDCLMGWLNGHRSCPTCRSSVVKVENNHASRRRVADWERERERERAVGVLY